jgi:hypothetical protein
MMGEGHWTKRSKETGRFMDVKKGTSKYKGVHRDEKVSNDTVRGCQWAT